MADSEVFGLPRILINFKTRSTTAISRSAHGIGVMILNDSHVTELKKYTVTATDSLPDGLDGRNLELIRAGLLGTPLKILVYLIPPAVTIVTREVDGETVTEEVAATVTQADVLREVGVAKWNYICHPTGKVTDQQSLASWVQSQRANKQRTFKAVVADFAADNMGVINFTTGGIKVENPSWRDAFNEAEGDINSIPATIPRYLTYTAAEYTARIMGVLCGIGLDRSATFYELEEVIACDSYDDIDMHIDRGELCLFDDHDGNGVKIARACNSLKTFTAATGKDFRYIKIVDAVDMIHDDIAETFKQDYVGKIANSYDNKMLFIAAIHVYFNGIRGSVLSPNNDSRVEIDTDAHRDYAALHGIDITNWSDTAINRINTSTEVYLRGTIAVLNSMEDLQINFTLM